MFNQFIPFLATAITAFIGGGVVTAVACIAVRSYLGQRTQRRAQRANANARQARQEVVELRHRISDCQHNQCPLRTNGGDS